MLYEGNNWIPAAYAQGRYPGRLPLSPDAAVLGPSHIVRYDLFGRIDSIDGKSVTRNAVTGRIETIGGERVSYNISGRMDRVGQKYVHHDPFGRASF